MASQQLDQNEPQRVILRHRSVIQRLSEMVQALASCSGENVLLALEIQELIIERMSYVERQIRRAKGRAKLLRGRLRTRCEPRLSREEANAIKREQEIAHARVEEYRFLHTVLRQFGDAVAFVYLSQWDIKPLNFKESPGFITQKKGGRLERAIVRHLAKREVAAVLNDITNCLRYGDVTVPQRGQLPIIIEAKSGAGPESMRNARLQRQSSNCDKVMKYLRDDVADMLYGQQADWRRVSLPGEVGNQRAALNQLLLQCGGERSGAVEVEPGLSYGVIRGMDASLVADLLPKVDRPVVAALEPATWVGHAYFPITLSVVDGGSLFRILNDEVVLVVQVDADVFRDHLRAGGLEVEFLRSGEFALKLSGPSLVGFEGGCVSVSSHLFGRLFAEFLGLRDFACGLIGLVDEIRMNVSKWS